MKRIVFTALLLGLLLSCAQAQTMYIDAGSADRVHLREGRERATRAAEACIPAR